MYKLGVVDAALQSPVPAPEDVVQRLPHFFLLLEAVHMMAVTQYAVYIRLTSICGRKHVP
jgi:hypothetical protein